MIDHETGFHTRSVLALPLHDTAGGVLGVLELLNKTPSTATPPPSRLKSRRRSWSSPSHCSHAIENIRLQATQLEMLQTRAQEVVRRGSAASQDPAAAMAAAGKSKTHSGGLVVSARPPSAGAAEPPPGPSTEPAAAARGARVCSERLSVKFESRRRRRRRHRLIHSSSSQPQTSGHPDDKCLADADLSRHRPPRRRHAILLLDRRLRADPRRRLDLPTHAVRYHHRGEHARGRRPARSPSRGASPTSSGCTARSHSLAARRHLDVKLVPDVGGLVKKERMDAFRSWLQDAVAAFGEESLPESLRVFIGVDEAGLDTKAGAKVIKRQAAAAGSPAVVEPPAPPPATAAAAAPAAAAPPACRFPPRRSGSRRRGRRHDGCRRGARCCCAPRPAVARRVARRPRRADSGGHLLRRSLRPPRRDGGARPPRRGDRARHRRRRRHPAHLCDRRSAPQAMR